MIPHYLVIKIRGPTIGIETSNLRRVVTDSNWTPSSHSQPSMIMEQVF